MNYPIIYNLTKLKKAVEKDPDMTLSMIAAATFVGTFPATITRARKAGRLKEAMRPFSKRPEVTGASVLAYFEEINRNARLVKATPKKKKAAPKPKTVAEKAPKKKVTLAPKAKAKPAKKKPASTNLLTKVVAKSKKK